MFATVILLCLLTPDGYISVESRRFGTCIVTKQDDVTSFPIHQRVLVIDKHGRVVWEHAGESESSYDDVYEAPDFDGHGVPEAVIVERNYFATGQQLRISIHSLGLHAKNLLVLYTHTYGRLMDDDFKTIQIGEQLVFVSAENELAYWIGPRGGAPYPVAFTFSTGRMRLTTNQFPKVVTDHLNLIARDFDPSVKPGTIGDLHRECNSAMSEFATKSIIDNPERVIVEMRKTWSAPIVDFLVANEKAILYKPQCYTYATPYKPIPSLPPINGWEESDPIWPPSTKYISGS